MNNVARVDRSHFRRVALSSAIRSLRSILAFLAFFSIAYVTHVLCPISHEIRRTTYDVIVNFRRLRIPSGV